MVPIEAFAAGGWWVGLSVASVLIAALAALVLTVITLVNRIERQAASIIDHLVDTGEETRPLLDLVEANFHLQAIAKGVR
jgi:predicted PurR-regulated permease PerM